MASQFDGMSLNEMNEMPMVGEATGLQLAQIVTGKRPFGFFEVALKQEAHVRRCLIRCPWWRPRKRAKLQGALSKATLITKVILEGDLRATREKVPA